MSSPAEREAREIAQKLDYVDAELYEVGVALLNLAAPEGHHVRHLEIGPTVQERVRQRLEEVRGE